MIKLVIMVLDINHAIFRINHNHNNTFLYIFGIFNLPY